MTYPVAEILGIKADEVSALKSVGIRTTATLLEAAKDAKGRKRLALNTGLSEQDILRWANMADRMRIKGVGKENAELLREAGVDTVKELKYRNPERLAKAMKEANNRRKLLRALPSDRAIVRWIEQAKKLPLKITY